MYVQRSICWMHGRSLLRVSFTCVSQFVGGLALAFVRATSATAIATHAGTTHLMR